MNIIERIEDELTPHRAIWGCVTVIFMMLASKAWSLPETLLAEGQNDSPEKIEFIVQAYSRSQSLFSIFTVVASFSAYQTTKKGWRHW